MTIEVDRAYDLLMPAVHMAGAKMFRQNDHLIIEKDGLGFAITHLAIKDGIYKEQFEHGLRKLVELTDWPLSLEVYAKLCQPNHYGRLGLGIKWLTYILSIKARIIAKTLRLHRFRVETSRS